MVFQDVSVIDALDYYCVIWAYLDAVASLFYKPTVSMTS